MARGACSLRGRPRGAPVAGSEGVRGMETTYETVRLVTSVSHEQQGLDVVLEYDTLCSVFRRLPPSRGPHGTLSPHAVPHARLSPDAHWPAPRTRSPRRDRRHVARSVVRPRLGRTGAAWPQRGSAATAPDAGRPLDRQHERAGPAPSRASPTRR